MNELPFQGTLHDLEDSVLIVALEGERVATGLYRYDIDDGRVSALQRPLNAPDADAVGAA